jgi:hypothetical protein
MPAHHFEIRILGPVPDDVLRELSDGGQVTHRVEPVRRGSVPDQPRSSASSCG